MPDETQEQKVSATETEEAEVQPEVDAQPEEQQEGLPEDASERTKREFEKLKKHNEELALKLAAKESQTPRPSLLDQFVPQAQVPEMPPMPQVATSLPQAQAQEIVQQLWDEEGTIDGNELQRRLQLAEQAERKAQEAQQKANQALERIARYEVEGQKKLLHDKYPELNPSSDSFDEEAYDLVQGELLKQLWASGQQDALAAADKLSKFWKTPKVTQEQKETLQARQAVQTSATGKASTGAYDDYEELRKQSLYSKEAMEERIRRAGI